MAATNGTPLAREGDPSSTFNTSSFVSSIACYLRDTLKYTSPSNYAVSSNAIASWDLNHDGHALPETVPDLVAAIARNPKLKVLSVNGYHDLATPFFQTELDLARLGSNPNIQTKFYSGGHMTCLDDTARVLQKADLVAFYQSAVKYMAPMRLNMANHFFTTLAGLVRPFAALILVSAFAPAALALTATADAPMRDPWVPLDTRKAAATMPTQSPTSGAQLQAQVERKLKLSFDAAVVNSDGTLTAAQANAAELGFIVRHFDEIDQSKRGVVRFEDMMRFMNARSAAAGLSHR